MVITHLKLKNWRNFRDLETDLHRASFVIGPNASGKSNFLDVFRFLRDVCKPEGGGLQKAIRQRGGIRKLRCLHHRRDPEVRIEVHFSEAFETSPKWRYVLGFKPEGKGAQRTLVTVEHVYKYDEPIVTRPNADDRADGLLLTETYLEQTLANREFREIVGALSEVTYSHLVPQLLKYSEQIGGNRLEDDPFGQGFLERVARSPERTRNSRLKRIEQALSIAVPQFQELKFEQDEMGHPHLAALYRHHRPKAGWQREEDFSDGTLRLLALLWSLQEGRGLLLLEEPELSLHEGVIEQIPSMLDRVQRAKRGRRQIIISTHSEAMLNNPGIEPSSVIVLQPGKEGTEARPLTDAELKGLEAGLTVADVVLPQTRPKGIEQLGLWE